MSRPLDRYPGTWAERTPDHPAVVMAGTGETVSYAELDATANRLSRLFRSAGLQQGDHVAFCMENRPEFMPILWGAHYAGLYYTAISSRLTSDELAYIVANSGSQVLLASPAKAEALASITEPLSRLKMRLSVGGEIPGFEPFEQAIAAQSAEPLGDRVESQPMLYSSGTTGQPKGVKTAFTGRPLGAGEGLTNFLIRLFGVGQDSVYLCPAPLYHAAPLRYSTQFHRLGATVVVMERFDAEAALAAIERYRVTHSQWVPTMFVRLLKLSPETRQRYDLSSLQAVIHAAAPCPIPVKEEIIRWLGPIVHEYYSGTESNGLTYCDSEQWLGHKGSVGKAVGCEVHIVGEDGREVPVGEEGAVYFGEAKGPGFEYHNEPDKTAASFLDNGWSTLGDIGKLDQDGFLYLTDRKSNMIITGGVNVYPQETENVLAVHPKVHDVAVIGVPNPDFGEEVKAIVQPVDMSDAGEALASELIGYCRERLADIKCPRSVEFRAELPRHPTGKLYKRLLRDEYWQGHQSRIGG